MMKRKILNVFLPIIIAFCFPLPVTAEGTYISQTAEDACVEYGNLYNICPEVLMAIAETESSGNPNAFDGECAGMMQINPKWHADRMERLGVADIFDERGNILVAADYLAELRDKYGEISLVLDIYNGNSNSWKNYENGAISDYAKKVLDRSAELEELREK